MSTELKVVMFTDQVSSTRNMARRTPAEIEQVARAQDNLTADVVRQCRGTILKDMGDGHLAEVPTVLEAVQAGILLQWRVAERNTSLAEDQLRFDLRVGIDFSEAVILPDGGLRANTANLAARVCSVCPAGEVYLSSEAARVLKPEEVELEEAGALALGDVEGEAHVYRVAALRLWPGAEQGTNPFIWRGGVTRAEDFFDRETEQRVLRSYLRGRQNCQIVGPRRIGKTSMLLRVERRAAEWGQSSTVAYLDSYDARCSTLSGWLALASRQLGRSEPPANLIEFTEHVEDLLASGRHPVLCLDGFEQLAARREEFAYDFFMTLRSCGQRGMSIVTASRRPLHELTDTSDPTSPFYNTFPLLRLGPFSPADAEDFINLHRPGVPPFSAAERDAILMFSEGHPLALQVACFHVLEAKQGRTAFDIAMRSAGQDIKALLAI